MLFPESSSIVKGFVPKGRFEFAGACALLYTDIRENGVLEGP